MEARSRPTRPWRIPARGGYEAYDAIEADDLDALREELGDVLLQVVLHARLAEELPEDERWTIDDVAGDLVAKMIRRNPHVFAGDAGRRRRRDHRELGADQKGREVPRLGAGRHRAGQPALALAAKILQPREPARCRSRCPCRRTDLGGSRCCRAGRRGGGGADAEAALRARGARIRRAVRAAERENVGTPE